MGHLYRKGAREYITQSIDINPGLWSGPYFFAYYKSALGQLDEAINFLKRAYELDPLSNRILTMMGLVYIMNREYVKGIEYCNKALELTPNDPHTLANLAMAYAKKGDYEKAISILEEEAKRYSQNPFYMSALGFTYGIAEKKVKAQEIVEGFIDISKKRYFPALFISRVYAGMGDVDKAIEWLEKAYEDREPFVYLIKSISSHDYMRSDPRFIEILAKMGLAN